MSEVTFTYLSVFFLALILSFLFIPLTRYLALAFNIVDHPGGRKIHDKAIPCLGGLAVYFAFVLVVVGSLSAFYLLHKMQMVQHFLPDIYQQRLLIRSVLPKLFALLGGSTTILLIGLVDDIVGVKFDYRLKLMAQVGVALWMVLAGIQLDFLDDARWNSILTIFWIVGITNAFNLLDNMDGLSGGVGYICAMLFFFIAAKHGQYFVALIFLALAGGVLGFLYFNFHPARVFLGNTGALFIGFLMATITVLQTFGKDANDNFFPFLMPFVILSLPIFDTGRVILIRLYEKRPVFQGDRRHVSHRLVELGMTQRQAVVTVYVMTFALGIGSTVLDIQDKFANTIVVMQTLSIIALISLLMSFGRK